MKITDITIKVRISQYLEWGYKLVAGQEMILEDHYPCKFLKSYEGTWKRYDDEDEKSINVTWYTIKTLNDGLYPKGKIIDVLDTNLHVELAVIPKKLP